MKTKYLALCALTAALAVCAARAQTNTPYPNEINWALTSGSASQSSDLPPGTTGLASAANDGNTDGNYANLSVSHTGGPALDAQNPSGPLFGLWNSYWSVDLGQNYPIGSLHVWFRTDCCQNRNDDFTVILYNDANNQVFNRSYQGRPPLDLIYNLGTAIQGRYVVVLPQSPLTTSDGYISLAEVQAIAPYTNVTINVTTNPPDATVTEGRRVTLGPVAATVVGAPQDRLTYQWQKSGVDIPGATGSTYTTPVATMGDNNAQFRVICLVSGVAVPSTAATLTVLKDTVPPVANSLVFASGPTLRATVTYNEVMDPATSINTANYNFGAGVTVTGATLSPVLTDPSDQHVYQTVLLSIIGLAQNGPYSLDISGVKDLGLNTIVTTNFNGTTPFYEVNWAMAGTATMSSTNVGGEPWRAIDGNTDGFFANGSVALSGVAQDDGWWEVDLGTTKPIGKLAIWFRTLTADECQALFNACTIRNDNFTLKILDQNRAIVWQRTYPGRPPTSVPYNFPTALNGRYVRFEPANAPITDGIFSLAEVQVIAPYENVSISVTQNPANTTVTENRVAIFSAAATAVGAPQSLLTYQWQKGGVDIAGATTPTYQTPTLVLGDGGSSYACKFLLSGISTLSAAATVTVLADTNAPTIQKVVGDATYTFVTVTFSEGVTAASAGTIGNYALNGGLSISEVTVLTPNSVRLTTSVQTPGTLYTLTVNNIRDLASGGGNLIAANSVKTFTAATSLQDRFVRIGDLGNPPDPLTGSGQVNYAYWMSKYMITVSEFANFLNSVATAIDYPHQLWVGGMAPQIARTGTDSYSYEVTPGQENRPISFITAVSAMRYANWLHNGSTPVSETENGVYPFTGELTFGSRDPNALYFLPTFNEYYKAAYYDPTKGGSSYWLYAVRSDCGYDASTCPNGIKAEAPPGGPHSANFLMPGSVAPAPDGVFNTTDVGAFTAASSYYGTFDQSGNQWEWIEPAAGAGSTRRHGGSQGNGPDPARLAANAVAQNGVGPGGNSQNQSARLAKADRLVIDMVTIGNPGNPSDTLTGAGKVDYVYRMGKYMVRVKEFATFLNAVATATNYPHAVYVGGMAPQIVRTGTDSYSYEVVAGQENRPISFATTVAAMRFCNWLHNGGTVGSDTESGAYTFTGELTFGARNPNAKFFLPTFDEYYKAAYYDPTKGGSSYWLYAVRSDCGYDASTCPNGIKAEAPPGGPHSANFLMPGSVVPAPDGVFNTTDVGAYTAASSYYGTFDQSGNQWEWIEPAAGAGSTRRHGGSQGNGPDPARLAANAVAQNGVGPGGNSQNQSFRIAAPEVGALVRATLSIQQVPTGIKVNWTSTGTLESAQSITGPWIPETGATNGQVFPNIGTRFYRLLQ